MFLEAAYAQLEYSVYTGLTVYVYSRRLPGEACAPADLVKHALTDRFDCEGNSGSPSEAADRSIAADKALDAAGGSSPLNTSARDSQRADGSGPQSATN